LGDKEVESRGFNCRNNRSSFLAVVIKSGDKPKMFLCKLIVLKYFNLKIFQRNKMLADVGNLNIVM
jgi:hypothetical protein